MQPEKPESMEHAYQDDDQRLVSLLASIKPLPTERFYRNMKNAPWAAKASRPIPGLIPSLRSLPRNLILRVTVAALLLFLTASWLVFPQLQSTAQQLFKFFILAPADSMTVQVTVPPLETIPGPDTWRSFSLTLADAETMAAYELVQLDPIPAGFTFQGAHYEPTLKAVTLLYTRDNELIYFTQRLEGSIQDYSRIGGSTPVEQVQVGDSMGEYVRGGWRMASESQQRLGTSVPGTQVQIGVNWDPDLAQSTLRWQTGERKFELHWVGGKTLDQASMVKTALDIH